MMLAAAAAAIVILVPLAASEITCNNATTDCTDEPIQAAFGDPTQSHVVSVASGVRSAPPPAAVAVVADTNRAVQILAGAHYFAGWSRVQGPGNFSHFHGFTPTGQAKDDWRQTFPERTPLLGYSTEATVAREVIAADSVLDFFDMLYFDAGPDCGPNPQDDPGLRRCLNSPLAFMLNSTTIWQNTSRLHFFISYVTSTHSSTPYVTTSNCFVGTAGDRKWAALVKTWVAGAFLCFKTRPILSFILAPRNLTLPAMAALAAMAHPRYLRVNNRPVFKFLHPRKLMAECGNNATLVTLRLDELRVAAIARRLGNPLIGGGWQNPSTAAGVPKPHPHGFTEFKNTKLDCGMSECTIDDVAAKNVQQCQALCNSTAGCVAVTISHNNASCALLNSSARGKADPTHDTWVRARVTVEYDFTGTYNAAPVINHTTHKYLAKYTNSWWPNHSKTGAESESQSPFPMTCTPRLIRTHWTRMTYSAWCVCVCVLVQSFLTLNAAHTRGQLA